MNIYRDIVNHLAESAACSLETRFRGRTGLIAEDIPELMSAVLRDLVASTGG